MSGRRGSKVPLVVAVLLIALCLCPVFAVGLVRAELGSRRLVVLVVVDVLREVGRVADRAVSW